ncbi:MAG: CoA-binding protein [Pseudomonadales bacterium]|nr:CoA-binding protein [Pseudomonadales bacterium]
MTDIKRVLEDTRTIAIVGISDNPSRPSNEVARYLMPYFDIIPVNPRYDSVLGLKCYPDLESIPVQVDMVDLFQRSENIPPFVRPAISIGARYFWMQLGISNADARNELISAGITVIEDKCTKIEYARYCL